MFPKIRTAVVLQGKIDVLAGFAEVLIHIACAHAGSDFNRIALNQVSEDGVAGCVVPGGRIVRFPADKISCDRHADRCTDPDDARPHAHAGRGGDHLGFDVGGVGGGYGDMTGTVNFAAGYVGIGVRQDDVFTVGARAADAHADVGAHPGGNGGRYRDCRDRRVLRRAQDDIACRTLDTIIGASDIRRDRTHDGVLRQRHANRHADARRSEAETSGHRGRCGDGRDT